jgi:Flp pilus assembly pilin Flp
LTLNLRRDLGDRTKVLWKVVPSGVVPLIVAERMSFWWNDARDKSQIARGNASVRGEYMSRIASFMQHFDDDESGQGLVEYLLIIALIAFLTTAGMSTAASYFNDAFVAIGNKLATYIS